MAMRFFCMGLGRLVGGVCVGGGRDMKAPGQGTWIHLDRLGRMSQKRTGVGMFPRHPSATNEKSSFLPWRPGWLS